MQRLRLSFSRGEELKYISHLDLMRLWQRVLRRADIPLAYSQGFRPHPRLSLAAPLAIGVTSSGELMDIFLQRRVSPHFFMKTVVSQLPHGIDISSIEEIGVGLPSLQSKVLYAEYTVCVETDRSPGDVEAAIRALLDRDTLPWQHVRDREVRKYDLRTLIEDIWLLDSVTPDLKLGMLLRCDNKGTGRPEQVTLALGFDSAPKYIHRTRLILDEQNRHSSQR